MRRVVSLLMFTAALAFTGCQSHEAKVVNLQEEYDRLAAQFQKDCHLEALKVPPNFSAKCADEDNKMADAWKRLQAAQAKR